MRQQMAKLVFISICLIVNLIIVASVSDEWIVGLYQRLMVRPNRVHTTHPCEDFYGFACSNYRRENADYDEITQQLDYTFNHKLSTSLQFAIAARKLLEIFLPREIMCNDNMLQYFESCNHQQNNFTEYLNVVKPLLEDMQRNDNFNFWPLLGLIQSYGLNNVIVKHHITRNSDNSLHVQLSPAYLEKTKTSFFESPSLATILKILGYSDVETAKKQLHAIDSEWREVADRYNNVHEGTIRVPFKTLKLYWHNLSSYFDYLLSEQLNNHSVIDVPTLRYFKYLNEKTGTTAEQKQLCNYLVVKFLLYLHQDSTNAFEPLECLKDLRNKFDLAVNYMYYQYLFKEEAPHFAWSLSSMFQSVRQIVSRYFEENHLNLPSKQIMLLKTKLQDIKINIGNLPDNCNLAHVQTFYQDLPTLDRTNYHKNHLSLLKHQFHKSISNPEAQSVGATGATPYYLPGKNMIVIPFASLQLPLFHYSQTPLQQLSIMGFILAHEITHAFDTIGLNYYPERIRNMFGESNITNSVNFNRSVDCMRQQEPTNSVNERIADLFGVRVAYRTYAEFYANGQNNWQKVFFENLAKLFCGKENVLYRDHDTDRVRLHQIVKNFEPFAQTYGCFEWNPMSVTTKCRLY